MPAAAGRLPAWLYNRTVINPNRNTTMTKDWHPLLVHLPRDIVTAIDQIAERDLISRSAWIRRALAQAARAEPRAA